MGNQCTGTRMKDMMTCIDFKKETLTAQPTKFDDEEDIHQKIDKFVNDYHKERKTKKSRKRKHTAVSAPRISKKSNITTKRDDGKKEDNKKSDGVIISSDQSQGGYRNSGKHHKHKHNNQSSLSVNVRKEPETEGQQTEGVKSGKSSRDNLKLDFTRLQSKSGNATPERITMKKVQKSEEPSKSLWSSSNEPDVISPMNFSLNNLNFSTLVNKPEENQKSVSDDPQNVSLGEDTKEVENEAEVRIEFANASGYETPYLGMKVNPSYENLRKHSETDDSVQEIYRYCGNKIVPNQNHTGLTSSDSSSSSSFEEQKLPPKKSKPACADLPKNLFNKTAKIQIPTNLELEMEMEKDSEEECSYDFKPQKPKPSKRERSSSYRDSIENFKSRISKRKFYNYDVPNEKKEDDSFNKLLWGGYHKIVTNHNRDSHKRESEDDEAIVIEGKQVDPISYLHKGVMRRQKIARLSKSSNKFSSLKKH